MAWSLLLLCACATRPATPPPATPSPAGQGAGPLHDLSLGSQLSRNTILSDLDNNTDHDMVFRTLMQVLDTTGTDRVPPVFGPEVPVRAHTTGTLRFELPRLPDGPSQVAMTVLASPPPPRGERMAESYVYLVVERGRTTEVDWYTWEYPEAAAELRRPRKQPKMSPQTASRFVRPDGEWQGMLQEPDAGWPCMPNGSCGKARACITGQCLPCLVDRECLHDELCVLGHCLKGELVECSSRSDCSGPEAMCLLSGYTSLDVRGNGDMKAQCNSTLANLPEPTEAERLAEQARIDASIVATPPEPPGPPGPRQRALELLQRPPTP